MAVETNQAAEIAGRTLQNLDAIGLRDPALLQRIGGQSTSTGLSIPGLILMWKELRSCQPAIIDDEGSTSYRDVAPRIKAIAAALARRGIGPDSSVAVLCRNHRSFIEAVCGITLTGADAVFMNTGFAGPQIADVAQREGASALILDEEFTSGLTLGARFHVLAAHGPKPKAPTLDELATEPPADWSAAALHGRTIILTSGTTGTPKGARRKDSSEDQRRIGGMTLIDIMARLRFSAVSRVLIASPLFHAWGGSMLVAIFALGSTVVLASRFDAEATLAAIERHRVDMLLLVPVMMQRILALEPEIRKRYDLSSLRSVSVSGSALPGPLALAWMDAFGDHLHNVYGSTETGPVSIAGPEDLRAAPGTTGRPPLGTSIRILSADGTPLPPGEVGRIFTRTGMLFDEYTGGGRKQVLDGFMSTGDMGHLDADGRLFVEGRDDDMVISGGENVFPLEIEALLESHPEIQEVAVIGVPDAQYGQRLRAYVVPRADGALTEAAVKNFVRDRLARYKVPRDVVFLEELPRNATGKVLKRVLRQQDETSPTE